MEAVTSYWVLWAEYCLKRRVRPSVSGVVPCYLQRYLQTFSCGFGVVEKECNDSVTCSMKYYSSFWPFERVLGWCFLLGFFFSVWLILWKNGDSEEETVKWKLMFSEIFVVLETRVSSPPHISCFGAALFSCIDLFWKYFGHIKQAWKNQLNKSESSLSMGNMLLGVSYFSVVMFAELCASLCKLHNSGNRYCGEGDGPVNSF